METKWEIKLDQLPAEQRSLILFYPRAFPGPSDVGGKQASSRVVPIQTTTDTQINTYPVIDTNSNKINHEKCDLCECCMAKRYSNNANTLKNNRTMTLAKKDGAEYKIPLKTRGLG